MFEMWLLRVSVVLCRPLEKGKCVLCAAALRQQCAEIGRGFHVLRIQAQGLDEALRAGSVAAGQLCRAPIIGDLRNRKIAKCSLQHSRRFLELAFTIQANPDPCLCSASIFQAGSTCSTNPSDSQCKRTPGS
jgi:hypothetical protein